ncbi:hypothetical protein ABFS83_03G037400 [Erythranthe nasuta]
MSSCKIWVLCFYIILIPTTVSPLTIPRKAEGPICLDEKGNYTATSRHAANLKGLLYTLSVNIDDSGFYSGTLGTAKAVALCRADTLLDACRGCVKDNAGILIDHCPKQYQAILWSQFCMVRYSNETIFERLAVEPVTVFRGQKNVNASDVDEFKDIRKELMDDVRAKVANGSSPRMAEVGNRTTGPGDQKLYVFMQCTLDLSPKNCSSCLVEAALYLSGDSQAGTVYLPSCILRYGPTNVYNSKRLHEPILATPSLMPPPPLVPSPPPPGKHNENRIRSIITIFISIFACLLLVLCVGIYVMKRSKKKIHEYSSDVDGISTVESIQFDFGEIRDSTNGFSDDNKLGEGGFGPVYMGKLENRGEIAVKRLSKDSGQGEMEFKNEVLLVAKLQHKNLVRLLGFSIQGIERLLVYEFVPNGSLDQFLFDRIKSSTLDWDTRHKVIGGIAKGILYLHEDSRLQIIHRDLKASNILLDKHMNPKISDFGMAKFIVPDETQKSTSRIVGTYGYMAPEYAISGQFSVKSDVFSFGVIILEIISGQRKIFIQNGEDSGDLLSYAWRTWREGTTANLIDPMLRASSGSQRDMIKCIHIALLCVQENAVDRPTMASVVIMMNSLSITLPMPSKPGFYVPVGSFSGASIPYEHSLQTSAGIITQRLLPQSDHSSVNKYSSATDLYPL